MSDDDYTVEDWMEFGYKIDEVEIEIDEGIGDIDLSVLTEMRKASDFIKETLGIKTVPILTKSEMTDIYYVTNVYTEKDGLITAISKRPATEEDIKELGKSE